MAFGMMISDEGREILRKVALKAAARAMGLRDTASPVIDPAILFPGHEDRSRASE
jgi:hypothetical protein